MKITDLFRINWFRIDTIGILPATISDVNSRKNWNFIHTRTKYKREKRYNSPHTSEVCRESTPMSSYQVMVTQMIDLMESLIKETSHIKQTQFKYKADRSKKTN